MVENVQDILKDKEICPHGNFPPCELCDRKNYPEKNEVAEKLSIKEGIDNVFEENSELTSIGTKEQYSQYLETIFPESKIRSIVYHGGTLNLEDRGKDSFTGEFGGKYGLYFTGSKSRAKGYIKGGTQEYKDKSKVFSVLLNINNPLSKKVWGKWKFGLDRISEQEFSVLKENNADGLIDKDFTSHFTQITTQYVVLELDQTHILGSKTDLEKFKKFVENPNIDPNQNV